jgi:hypothetical protein
MMLSVVRTGKVDQLGPKIRASGKEGQRQHLNLQLPCITLSWVWVVEQLTQQLGASSAAISLLKNNDENVIK